MVVGTPSRYPFIQAKGSRGWSQRQRADDHRADGEGDPRAMGGRRARASFRYRAFVPDEIAALYPVVPFEVADLSADAEP